MFVVFLLIDFTCRSYFPEMKNIIILIIVGQIVLDVNLAFADSTVCEKTLTNASFTHMSLRRRRTALSLRRREIARKTALFLRRRRIARRSTLSRGTGGSPLSSRLTVIPVATEPAHTSQLVKEDFLKIKIGSVQENNSLKNKIFTLGQLHYDYMNMSQRAMNSEEYRMVAESQFKIGEEITNRSGAAVFVEGLDGQHPLTSKDRESYSVFDINQQIVLETFPEGWPSSFEALSTKQIELLALLGAPHVLFFLGSLDAMYPTISFSREQLKKIDDEIMRLGNSYSSFDEALEYSSDLRFLVNEVADRDFVRVLVKFINGKQNEGQDILIIFGQGHDLSETLNEANLKFDPLGDF